MYETNQIEDFAYWERNQLVAVLSKLFPSHLCKHIGNTYTEGYQWMVCIHLPTGQATWHIHDSDKRYFCHLNVCKNHWDGHTTKEKYEKVGYLKKRQGCSI